MLVQYGFVVQNPRTRAYAPGPGLIAIGSSVSASDDIQTALRPHLESLLATFGETIHICALRGAEVAFIGCIESQMALRAGNRTGTLLPAHATSSGKALLATLSDEEVKRLFPDDNLSARTRATIRTRTALLRELHIIRERGYATNSAESEHGLSAIACVVRSRTGEPRGAIAISGPQARMRKMDRTRMVAAMLRACAAARHSIR
jgi:DNA-binding IclR family transcriptional regulator